MMTIGFVAYFTFKKNPPKSKAGIAIGGPIESAIETEELTADIRYPTSTRDESE